MDITFDKATGQLVAFKDKIFKLAVITTHHHQGVFKNGVAQMELMPKSSWTIHWTSPSMHVDEADAVLAALKNVEA